MISNDNFYERAQLMISARGGKGFVIDRENPAQRDQWRQWMAYFAALDARTVPAGKKYWSSKALSKITTPTEWPIEFDSSAPTAPVTL